MNALSIIGREAEAHRRDVRRAEAFTLDRFTASFPSVAPLLAPSQNLEVRVTHPGRRKARGATGAAPTPGGLGAQSAPAPPQLTLAERMRRGLLDPPPLSQPAQEPPAAPAPPTAAAPSSATALLLSALGEASASAALASRPQQSQLPAARVNGYGARGRAGFRGRGRDPYERVLVPSSDTSSCEDDQDGGIVSEVFAPSLELAQRCLVVDSGTPSTRQSLRALRSIATAAVRLTLHRDRDPALGRDVTASLFAEVVEAACARLYAAGAERLELALTAAAPGAIATAGGSGAAATRIVARALNAALAAFGKGEAARVSPEAARAAVEECMPPFTPVCDEDKFLTRAAACVHSLASAGLLRPAVVVASDGFSQLLPSPAADGCADVLPSFLSTSMDHATCVISSESSEVTVPPAQSVAKTSGIEDALHAIHGYAGALRDRLWWWDALPAIEAFRWALVGAIIAQYAQPGQAEAVQGVEIPLDCTRRWSPMSMVAKFAARRGPGEPAEVGACKLAEMVTSSDAALFVAGSTVSLSDSALIARWAAYRVVVALLLEALVR